MVIASGRATAEACACDYAAHAFGAAAAVARAASGGQIEGAESRDIHRFALTGFCGKPVGIAEASSLDLGRSPHGGGCGGAASGEYVRRHHFRNYRRRTGRKSFQLLRRDVHCGSGSFLYSLDSTLGSGEPKSIGGRIKIRDKYGPGQSAYRLWLMIDRNRSTDQLDRPKSMLRSGDNPGSEHAEPHQECDHAGLRPGAENEFRPRRFRRRQQREWSLLRSGVCHNRVSLTSITTPACTRTS